MIRESLIAVVALAAVGAAGCATKTHVRQQIDPVQAQVDEVAARTEKHAATLNQHAEDIEASDREIAAAKERLGTAEGRIGGVEGRTERHARELAELRNVVANLDSYDVATEGTVYFGFDQDTLTDVGTAALDQMIAQAPRAARYFVVVEGYTDPIGPAEYNQRLSQRRAERVVQYLVLNHNIPVQRVFVIGLGKNRLVNEGRTRDALAKNRRVEVRFYAADAAPAAAIANPD
jgi:outer membrane protein OmpA-like peptidoglycan-associated protein